MAGSSFIGSGSGGNAQLTAFYSPLSIGGFGQASPTAKNTRLTAGDYRNLSINVLSYTSATNATVTLQVNGSNTALAVAVVGGATGRFTNIANTVTVADGDEGRINATSGFIASLGAWSMEFVAASGLPTTYYSGSGSLSSATSAREYFNPVGENPGLTANSADLNVLIRAGGTLDRVRVNVATNTKAATQTLTALVNGSNTAVSVVIPASVTGQFEDTTNTASVSAGDTVSLVIDRPGGTVGTFNMERFEWRFTSSAQSFDLITASQTINMAATLSYVSVAARSAQGGPVEDPISQRFPFAAALSRLRFYVTTTSATPYTVRTRINGGYGAQIVSVPANTSGLFEDTANTDSVALGDLVNYEISARSGVTRFNWLAITASTGGPPAETVLPLPGALEVEGRFPSVILDELVTPSAGEIGVEGGTPSITGSTNIASHPGETEVGGGTPTVFLGIRFAPTPGALVMDGGTPAIFTEFIVATSQQAVLATGETVADVRVSQQAVLAGGVVIPPVAVSQQAVLITADGVPCVTRWCQVWLMTRQDGEEFAFTSHDEPISFRGRVCKPCSSLNPSATEASSELGTIGNMELSGIVDDEAISEFDLYSGKFDGCYVEVWEVPWANDGTTPKRLAAGRTGSISHGRDGFAAEVLGIGAQIQQQAVTQVVTAACRFVFGDARCGKDIEALRVTGLVSFSPVAAVNRAFSVASLAGDHPDGYFVRGVVTFVTGGNAGLRAEVKEYDGATGTFVLWTAFPSEVLAGEEMSATPGCELSRDACIGWANLINFGGFPDVPGDDATSRTPDARY